MLITKTNVIYRYEKLRQIVWVKSRVELYGMINSELPGINEFLHFAHSAMFFLGGRRRGGHVKSSAAVLSEYSAPNITVTFAYIYR
jgi:hypothetical protein